MISVSTRGRQEKAAGMPDTPSAAPWVMAQFLSGPLWPRGEIISEMRSGQPFRSDQPQAEDRMPGRRNRAASPRPETMSCQREAADLSSHEARRQKNNRQPLGHVVRAEK